MATRDGGGGGGFWTFAVLPPLHPANEQIITANGRKRTHRRIATANLLELRRKAREVISLFESRLSVRKRRGRRGELSTTPQSYNLRAASRFGCQINGERSWIAARRLRRESHRQSTTTAGSEGKGTVIILRIIARHHDLADEIDGSRVGIVRVVEESDRLLHTALPFCHCSKIQSRGGRYSQRAGRIRDQLHGKTSAIDFAVRSAAHTLHCVQFEEII